MNQFGSALILAGGESRRMGFDKQFIEIKGTLLRDELVHSLSLIFEDVIIATKRPEIYTSLNVRTVADALPLKGPMAGVHAALKASRSEYLFVIACDMPFISPEYIAYMQDCLRAKPAKGIITSVGEGMVEPFHGFYHRDLSDRIEESSQGGFPSFKALAETENFIIVPKETADFFNNHNKLFLNLNTKEELLKYAGIEKA